MDIWKVGLGGSDDSLARGLALLGNDETQRAGGIGSEVMRRGFVLTRASLRWLLGRYLGLDPGGVRFTSEARGKPAISGHPEIALSASRCASTAVFAFSRSEPVGIDIETVRPIPQMNGVIERMFSPCEKRQLAGLAMDKLEQAFLACWTRKEAYAKAIGDGILAHFDKFCVDVDPGNPKPSIHFHDGLSKEEWFLHDLRFGDAFAAALACRGAERAPSIFEAASMDDLLFAHEHRM